MQSLLLLWRGSRFLLHLLTALLLVASAVALPRALGLRPIGLAALTRWWYRRLCRILGLRLTVTGGLAPGILLVANHISWLDIPVLGAQGDIAFLSKAEIRAWPLIGWMAEVLGTLFITRGANQARDIADQIARRARAGQVVVIFPEATTADGTQLRPFHPRLFAAAQESGSRLQPVALRYGEPDRLDRIAPFIGDDQPLPHLLRVLRHPGIRVQVQFLPPLASAGLDRKGMAEACRRAIGEALGLPRETGRPGPASPHRAQDTSPNQP